MNIASKVLWIACACSHVLWSSEHTTETTTTKSTQATTDDTYINPHSGDSIPETVISWEQLTEECLEKTVSAWLHTNEEIGNFLKDTLMRHNGIMILQGKYLACKNPFTSFITAEHAAKDTINSHKKGKISTEDLLAFYVCQLEMYLATKTPPWSSPLHCTSFIKGHYKRLNHTWSQLVHGLREDSIFGCRLEEIPDRAEQYLRVVEEHLCWSEFKQPQKKKYEITNITHDALGRILNSTETLVNYDELKTYSTELTKAIQESTDNPDYKNDLVHYEAEKEKISSLKTDERFLRGAQHPNELLDMIIAALKRLPRKNIFGHPMNHRIQAEIKKVNKLRLPESGQFCTLI